MSLLIRDSSGKPSWSYTLAVPSLLAITAWFVTGGFDVTVAGVHVLTATKAGSEYALAITPWLAYLGHRRTTPKPEAEK